MATPSETNLCSFCNKLSGTNYCFGCKKYFCRRDYREHEQQLTKRFDDEIVLSHDQLLEKIQKLENSTALSSDLFIQIDQWKNSTIERVEKAARKASEDLTTSINRQRIKIKEQFERITTEIRQRREEDNFLENDIDLLVSKLNEIQGALQTLIQGDISKSIIVDNNKIDWNRIIYIKEYYADRSIRPKDLFEGDITLTDINNFQHSYTPTSCLMISRYSDTIIIVKKESNKLLQYTGDAYSVAADLSYTKLNDILDTSSTILIFYRQNLNKTAQGKMKIVSRTDVDGATHLLIQDGDRFFSIKPMTKAVPDKTST
ncbi:unnamed protein product [Rotaria socialis]|uniref:B box-type domain-containing protein n=1 Tax=Rotaria socialis TaxID=392032 RepID=A0A818HBJ8_9BILA|nr:unnamed protein product [Rotaria socialis]